MSSVLLLSLFNCVFIYLHPSSPFPSLFIPCHLSPVFVFLHVSFPLHFCLFTSAHYCEEKTDEMFRIDTSLFSLQSCYDAEGCLLLQNPIFPPWALLLFIILIIRKRAGLFFLWQGHRDVLSTKTVPEWKHQVPQERFIVVGRCE